jgi:hypothetical protein
MPADDLYCVPEVWWRQFENAIKVAQILLAI